MSAARDVIARALEFEFGSIAVEVADMVLSDLSTAGYRIVGPGFEHDMGDRLTKISGSKWTGPVRGFYSTKLTPVGYVIESETETGSAQIYPAKAVRSLGGKDA